MRRAEIRFRNVVAGTLIEDESGYHFTYDEAYRTSPETLAISLTMPKSNAVYHEKTLHPFFDGLIPEGWMLDIVERNWKVNVKDRMGLLMVCCRDCIGAVSVHPMDDAS
jgi:serine/threonine-protein kinase HipA